MQAFLSRLKNTGAAGLSVSSMSTRHGARCSGRRVARGGARASFGHGLFTGGQVAVGGFVEAARQLIRADVKARCQTLVN